MVGLISYLDYVVFGCAEVKVGLLAWVFVIMFVMFEKSTESGPSRHADLTIVYDALKIKKNAETSVRMSHPNLPLFRFREKSGARLETWFWFCFGVNHRIWIAMITRDEDAPRTTEARMQKSASLRSKRKGMDVLNYHKLVFVFRF